MPGVLLIPPIKLFFIKHAPDQSGCMELRKDGVAGVNREYTVLLPRLEYGLCCANGFVSNALVGYRVLRGILQQSGER